MSIIETLRSVRISGYALFDFVVSYAALLYILKDAKLAAAALLPIGFTSHLLFRQNTPMTELLCRGTGLDANILRVILLSSILYIIYRAV